MDTWLIIFVASIALGSYAGMHYYLYRKLLWVFPLHKKAVAVYLVALASLFFIVMSLTRIGFSQTATPLAWTWSIWIGYVFIFFVFAGTVDVVIKVASFYDKDSFLLRIKQRTKTIFSSGVVFLICVAGFISAQQINISSHTLATAKLDQPITIVQISDLHLGLLSRKGHIQKLVDEINALQADIIVSTGDLVDVQVDHLDDFSKILAKLYARLGKYAVYGNHEALAGLDKSRTFTEQADFTILSNRGISLDNAINIVGIDDSSVQRKQKITGEHERILLKKYSSELFTLFLKHQPIVSQEAQGLFNLQLSGHTHGGQIFPFNMLTKLIYPAPFGLSKIKSESWLYVSKGTGTWGPQMRVLAEPEVSVFYLVPKE